SLLPRATTTTTAAAAAPLESSPSTPAAPCAAPNNLSQVIVAREAVYGQLTRAAEMLAQLEPHSPIPYLVRRAVELGKLPFPQRVQQLIREERILTDLQREFGLNENA